MFEKSQKSLIEPCERSNLQLEHLSGQKFIETAKIGQFSEFLKPEACCQTVLPDSKKDKCDIFGDF